MRKSLLVLALAACLPLVTFAAGSDFQLGVSALYPYSLQEMDKGDGFEATYISPGLETRLRFLHILQVGANATLVEPFNDKMEGVNILSSFDGGLCIDLFLVRLGAGLGPTVAFNSDKDGTSTRWNARVYAELQLGKLSLGISGFYFFEEAGDIFTTIGDKIDDPILAATLLFKL
jgi:hypothetical protein